MAMPGSQVGKSYGGFSQKSRSAWPAFAGTPSLRDFQVEAWSNKAQIGYACGSALSSSKRSFDSKRAVFLSSTHKLDSDQDAEFDICSAGQSSPDDGVAGRRIMRTSEIAPDSGQHDDIVAD